MSLSEYLNEGLLSKKTGLYGGAGLPEHSYDKEGIIVWLERNGFENITKEYSLSTDEMRYQQAKSYTLGPYKPGKMATWWINAGDGDGNSISVRTLTYKQLKDLNKIAPVPMYEATICKKDEVCRESTWEEARELLIKMARK